MVVRASNSFSMYIDYRVDGKLITDMVLYASEEEGFIDCIHYGHFTTMHGKVTLGLKAGTPPEAREQYQSALEYQEAMKRIK